MPHAMKMPTGVRCDWWRPGKGSGPRLQAIRRQVHGLPDEGKSCHPCAVAEPKLTQNRKQRRLALPLAAHRPGCLDGRTARMLLTKGIH